MKKRRAMILSVLTAGVLALTGCGSTQSAETDPEADSTVVENAVDEPNVADETADANDKQWRQFFQDNAKAAIAKLQKETEGNE